MIVASHSSEAVAVRIGAARWALLILIGLGSGCAQISVRPADANRPFDAVAASLGSNGTLSPRTLQTLRQFDLEETYIATPTVAFQRLQAEADKEAQPDVVFALAELCYLFGEQSERCREKHCCAWYYLCAGYAYHYLFDREEAASIVSPRPAPGRGGGGEGFASASSPFDPRYRLACDLYNTALAQCIRTAQQAGKLDPRQKLQLPTPDGQTFTLSVEHHGFAWGPEEFGTLLFCTDYQVVGLENQYRRYGLGVPLIGTRDTKQPPLKHAYFPDLVSFPVSAFFRFEGSVADLGRQRTGVLELYNPLAQSAVAVRDRSVPLECDLTTPLAYFLSRSDLQSAEYRGFLTPDAAGPKTGIYMLEPYQPGKIPVLMVHGLLSSPLTWAPLFNDLRADPELRKHYQFWFFLYPTGPGYLQAASDLRRDLAGLRAELDPDGRDGNLDRMVLVGHSMGGLVSQLLTVDSGNDFWHLVSEKPLGQLPLDQTARQEFHDMFYFPKQPGIERVIFIGTPHRGSALGPSLPGRLAAKFVHLPQTFMQSATELIKVSPPDALGKLWYGKLPTSVDLLSPGSPALEVLLEKPRPADVHFHSIIGEAAPRTLLRELTRPIVGNEKSDGVVPYSSAHLDGVESEVIVPADHLHVHHHPLAVREVRRILFEHLHQLPEQATGQ